MPSCVFRLVLAGVVRLQSCLDVCVLGFLMNETGDRPGCDISRHCCSFSRHVGIHYDCRDALSVLNHRLSHERDEVLESWSDCAVYLFVGETANYILFGVQFYKYELNVVLCFAFYAAFGKHNDNYNYMSITYTPKFQTLEYICLGGLLLAGNLLHSTKNEVVEISALNICDGDVMKYICKLPLQRVSYLC